MMTASEKAVQKLEDYLIRRCLDAGLGFRVANDSHEPGHAVLVVKLDNEHTGDEVITSHGIRIFVDPASAALLKDCELDYLDEPTGGFCLKTNRMAAGGSQVRGCENI
jgi:Fe-S cluster assembly iron-binding protein IscA